MKNMKKYAGAAISLWMLLCLFPVPAAAENSYDYQITFYAGNQGRFTGLEGLEITSRGDVAIIPGEEKITIKGLSPEDIVTFKWNQGAITLNEDSKYYVQGFRLSGRDNDGSTDAPSFYVTGDADYVAAYGIQGDMTRYVVNYIDEEGNTLAPSQTYYGNVGDKPVVAYHYIQNYMPRTLTLTKTLSANEAENVFTFSYSAVPVETIPGTTVTITTIEPGTSTVITQQVPAAGTGITGTAVSAAGTAAGAGTGGAGDNGTGTAAGSAVGTGTEEPGTTAGNAGAGNTGAQNGADNGEEIQGEDTPLAQIDLDEEGEEEGTAADSSENRNRSSDTVIPTAPGVAAVAAAAIIAGAVVLLRMKRK